MFVCSLKATTLRFFAVVSLCFIVTVSLLCIDRGTEVYASADGKEINYGGIKSADDRVKFVEQFGLKVKKDSETEEKFAMPKNFDRVISGYNQLQKEQGLDLSKYTGKRVMHYRMEVENYNYDGGVFVNLYVYKNKIVACDISSSDLGGFVLPLCNIDRKNLRNA